MGNADPARISRQKTLSALYSIAEACLDLATQIEEKELTPKQTAYALNMLSLSLDDDAELLHRIMTAQREERGR